MFNPEIGSDSEWNGVERRGGFSSEERLPSWAQTAIAIGKLIQAIGLPIVISAFLVWLLGMKVPRIEASQLKEEQAQQLILDQLAEQKVRDAQLIRLQMQTCLNTAKTSEDRRACLQ